MKTVLIIIPRKKRFIALLTLLPLFMALFLLLFVTLGKMVAGISANSAEDSTVSVQAQPEEPAGKLAIIIDDFGLDRNGVKEMMSIDRHLTFAVMPFLKYSSNDAADAHDKGYEVIIHLPMEPVTGKREWLGPKPILSGMSNEEVKHIVEDAIEDVPYASGANIHMGSKASSEESIVSSVLDVVGKKGLYFVDSRTSSKGIAARLAQSYGVTCYDRHIFLDEGQSGEHVKVQLQKAMKLAISKGKAVAIGHVGQEGGKTTALAIQEMLPEFDRNNVQLVFISELSED